MKTLLKSAFVTCCVLLPKTAVFAADASGAQSGTDMVTLQCDLNSETPMGKPTYQPMGYVIIYIDKTRKTIGMPDWGVVDWPAKFSEAEVVTEREEGTLGTDSYEYSRISLDRRTLKYRYVIVGNGTRITRTGQCQIAEKPKI